MLRFIGICNGFIGLHSALHFIPNQIVVSLNSLIKGRAKKMLNQIDFLGLNPRAKAESDGFAKYHKAEFSL